MRKTVLSCLLLTILLVPASRAAGSIPAMSSRPGREPGSTHVSIVVHPTGNWQGQATGPPHLLSALTRTLSDRRIPHTPARTADGQGAALTLTFSGDDPRAIPAIALETGRANARASGPIALALSGFARANESLALVLPGNPSTGYTWAVEPSEAYRIGPGSTQQTSSALGAPARQTVRLDSTATGRTQIHLAYRRPWEDAPPALFISIEAAGLDLAAACAALSLSPPSGEAEAPVSTLPSVSASALQTLPSSFNWCDQGKCTPIRDQGPCASCWAFATVGVLESAISIERNLTADLSEQYLLSCNTDGFDCDGGWFAHDYHWFQTPPGETEAGAVPEIAFPYQAAGLPCDGPYGHPFRISSWDYVAGTSIPSPPAIKQAIHDHGPVAVTICTGSAFQGYTGGVFQTDESCPMGPNHAVVLVGWDDAQQAWVLRNSWGVDWGEDGYMRIRYGTSGVGQAANYVVYEYTPLPDQAYLPLTMRGYKPTPSVANGDFEAGRDGSWSESSSNGWPLVMNDSDLPVAPRGGRWVAWLGGGDDETSILSQEVTIPLDASALDFWYHSGSEDLCGYDYAYVRFGSTTLATYDLCTSTNTGGWIHEQIGVTSWREQTVILRFVVTTNWSVNSNFFLDDVRLSTAVLSPAPPSPVQQAGPPSRAAEPQ